MSQTDENTDAKNWSEFEVFSRENHRSGNALFEDFKLFKSYFSSLPKTELVDRKWIESKDDIYSLVELFNEINSSGETTLFRKLPEADAALTALWLAKVRAQAKENMMIGEIQSYQSLNRANLVEVAKLSADVRNVSLIQGYLADLGVTVVFLRALPSLKLDGAVFKSPSGNPVIGMSLRYSRLDNFWFTLLHELSHVVLHFDLLDQPILEDLEDQDDSDIEISANRLAQSSFVSNSLWRSCEPRYKRDEGSVREFADQIGIHPSIVAGMLARETGDYAIYSKILNEFDVREVIFGDN